MFDPLLGVLGSGLVQGPTNKPNIMGSLMSPVMMAGLGALLNKKKPMKGAMMGLQASNLLSPFARGMMQPRPYHFDPRFKQAQAPIQTQQQPGGY